MLGLPSIYADCTVKDLLLLDHCLPTDVCFYLVLLLSPLSHPHGKHYNNPHTILS